MPQRVLELLTSWGVSFGYGPTKEVWRLVLMCLMWCLGGSGMCDTLKT
jgi:hypothetical protein